MQQSLANLTLMWWEDSLGGPYDVTNWLVANDLPSPTIVIWVLTLVLILRFLHVFSSPQIPKVTIREKSEKTAIKQILEGVEMLKKPYRPPSIWGRSGHIQTAAYGLLGHATLRRTFDRRVPIKLTDGTTVTFDIFESLAEHESGKEVTLVLIPGIANSSESNYIRTCVHFAQENGYRCAVLNHLGALADVKLTGNRIFSYGGTDEISAMMNFLFEEYSNSKFINIGFSMGGNVTTQYLLRMEEAKRNRILLGLSVGQGYSATLSTPMYQEWENGRRAYNYIITENMKRLLRRNYEQAVAPHVQRGLVDEQRLWASTSIVAFDEYYNRRVAGFANLDEFYEWVSCLPLLKNLRTRMVFLNAEDDPIVPRALWEHVKAFCSEHEDFAFISTRHGGHLGFLEGGSFSPNSVTWLDRFIVELADQTVKTVA